MPRLRKSATPTYSGGFEIDVANKESQELCKLLKDNPRAVSGLVKALNAGFKECVSRIDACIDIDPTTLRLPKNARTFALKVRGDSMRNAGILEGDIVIMEFREARHGDIVAALIDGETTLKRFIVHEGVPYLRLQPQISRPHPGP